MCEKEEDARATLAKLVLNAPIVVHDQRSFHELCMLFRTNTLIAYCDPKIHGDEMYKEILKTVKEARDKKPLNFEK